MNRKIHIDLLKVMAMLAVLVQHARPTLYYNDRISILAGFSVPLFMLIGGYNIYRSMEAKKKFDLKNSLIKILVPYVIASFIYECVVQEVFSLGTMLHNLVQFTSSYPLYYVALYLQMLLISPILFNVIKKCLSKSKKWLQCILIIIFMAIICVVCYLTANYTVMLDWRFWSSMLLGGPMLLFWVLGMLFAVGEQYVDTKAKNGIVIGISSIGIITYAAMTLTYTRDNLGSLFGNQGEFITIIDLVYACSIFWFVKSMAYFIKKKEENVACKIVTYVGKRTYYIFLYHIMFFILTAYEMTFPNLWVMRFVVFGAMLFGPLAAEFLLSKIGNLIRADK